jgi:hypothetical protein
MLVIWTGEDEKSATGVSATIVLACGNMIFRYPKDLQRRALIDSVLDWHHTNLRPNVRMSHLLPLHILFCTRGVHLMLRLGIT